MKHILILFLLASSICTLQAQDMKQLFIDLPDSIAPLLTKVNREDCVDFLDSQMKAEVKNRFGNPSELKQLTADYLLLQTTEQSTIQLKLLPQNDSVNIICAIFTACAPACDSEVRFYSTDWKLLNRENYLPTPTDELFFTPSDTLSTTDLSVMKQLDMNLHKIDVSPNSNELFIKYTTPDYLSKKEQEKVIPYLLATPLKYVWRESRFELDNPIN
ncbi:MAG: DUF3256 family protein [Phocaeicola sp.]